MFAGWITFSAYRDTVPDAQSQPAQRQQQHQQDEGVTMAQAQVLMRANDPLYELGLRLGGHRQEDRFWQHTLRSVAARFGVADATVQTDVVLIDPRLRWSYARNIARNAAVRTMLLGPTRWFRRR